MGLALSSLLLAAAPVSVIVMDVHVGAGADAAQAALVAEEIAGAMQSTAFKVTTAAQLTAVLGLERQKQLMGCSEDSSSCAAELASALGADIVVNTTLAKVEGGQRCGIAFISGRDGSALERASVEGSGNELFERVHDAVTGMSATVFTRLHPDLHLEPGTRGVRRFALYPALLGVALLAGSGVIFGVNENNWRTLNSRDGRVTNPYGLADTGRTLQTVAWVLGGVGGAALIAAGAMAAFGGPSAPRVVVAPVGGGAGVFFSGGVP